MIEMLLSDPVIFLMTSVGLVATGVSIVRDARSQRERLLAEDAGVEAKALRRAPARRR